MPNYYLQDILNECSVPERFNKPKPSGNKDENKALIIDFGSWQCRVGLSNEKCPSSNMKL